MAEHQAEPLLSPRFTEALLYTAELHARQRRKGGRVPYLAHLLGVTSIVLEDGGDEEEGIAALLHDAVEDHPREGRTEQEILDRFGARVHRIVMGCTDTYPDLPRAAGKKPEWEARKRKYIEHLRHEASPDVLRVAAADKLYNARSIINDMRLVGEEVWSRFSVPRERTLWYYREVTAALREATHDRSRLVRELAAIVAAMDRGVVRI
jgi:(p)ppGpp synthase/HD superfamily hydrolase